MRAYLGLTVANLPSSGCGLATMALGLLVVITVAGIEADQQFTSAHDDATLIEIDASVATPDEILAANNYFVRERV